MTDSRDTSEPRTVGRPRELRHPQTVRFLLEQSDLDALDAVIAPQGVNRAAFIRRTVMREVRRLQQQQQQREREAGQDD